MSAQKETARGAGQLLVDLGPILVFVIAFNVLNRIKPDQAIYIATGLFIAATLGAVAYAWRRTRKVPPVLIVTGVLVTVFGGLTIAFHNETFMKVKPTAVYLFYAVSIFGSLLARQNIWKLLFQHAFALPDRIWTILAVRWGLFFLFMAGLNEIVWRTQTTEFWVNSRFFLVFPLIFGFALLNAPLTMKHIATPPPAAPPESPPRLDKKGKSVALGPSRPPSWPNAGGPF
ncbi:MAG: inner membrane-spanning protein YciB [Hyphomonadaceae bacterium]